MKKTITMIMFTILSLSVFSLQADIRIGAKAGVNLAKASLSPDAIRMENFTGFQIGPVIEISGLTGLGVDAAILFSKHGLKEKETSNNNMEEKVNTLDVPVNLKMKFSLVDLLGCYLSAGPYVSFKLDDQFSLRKIKYQWENKKFGVGVNFGVGMILLKHLQVGVNYQLALNDDYRTPSGNNHNLEIIPPKFKAKTRIWSITAAYFF